MYNSQEHLRAQHATAASTLATLNSQLEQFKKYGPTGEQGITQETIATGIAALRTTVDALLASEELKPYLPSLEQIKDPEIKKTFKKTFEQTVAMYQARLPNSHCPATIEEFISQNPEQDWLALAQGFENLKALDSMPEIVFWPEDLTDAERDKLFTNPLYKDDTAQPIIAAHDRVTAAKATQAPQTTTTAGQTTWQAVVIPTKPIKELGTVNCTWDLRNDEPNTNQNLKKLLSAVGVTPEQAKADPSLVHMPLNVMTIAEAKHEYYNEPMIDNGNGWTWLQEKSEDGLRALDSYWIPGARQFYVDDGGVGGSGGNLGVRPPVWGEKLSLNHYT
jgi:hypothetical protein